MQKALRGAPSYHRSALTAPFQGSRTRWSSPARPKNMTVHAYATQMGVRVCQQSDKKLNRPVTGAIQLFVGEYDLPHTVQPATPRPRTSSRAVHPRPRQSAPARSADGAHPKRRTASQRAMPRPRPAPAAGSQTPATPEAPGPQTSPHASPYEPPGSANPTAGRSQARYSAPPAPPPHACSHP
ncbi:MAG: hypothetical protein JWN15_3556 [Firmicutes bacterium]|nr:hypothetical protein [Bacillota bacterium]